MRPILIFLLLMFPSKHIDRISVECATGQISIFHDYSNDNFIQKVYISNKKVRLSIENFGYINIDLNFRIFLNKEYLKTLFPIEKDTIKSLFHDTITLKSYLRNISYFIKDNISYEENSIYTRSPEVLKFKKTNCIGYSSLVRGMLNAISVKSSYVKGFYLKKESDGYFVPVPHRWLEISLPTGEKFFYDPQYQGFNANYIVMDGNIMFSDIKKFKVKLLGSNKKFIN